MHMTPWDTLHGVHASLSHVFLLWYPVLLQQLCCLWLGFSGGWRDILLQVACFLSELRCFCQPCSKRNLRLWCYVFQKEMWTATHWRYQEWASTGRDKREAPLSRIVVRQGDHAGVQRGLFFNELAGVGCVSRAPLAFKREKSIIELMDLSLYSTEMCVLSLPRHKCHESTWWAGLTSERELSIFHLKLFINIH